MSTVCKDCGVQGKGVHHCEQYHNQTHSIAEYQHIEKELQAKVEELTAEVDRLSVFEMNADMLLSEQATITELQAMVNELTAALKQASLNFSRSTKYGRGWHDALAYVNQAALKQEGE